MYEYPKLEMIPPKAPTIRHAPGLVIIPAEAPIITPPAKVAFYMWSIKNLFCKRAVIMKHPRLLAAKARIVFVTIMLRSKGVVEKNPALMLGQNIHRKKVPMSAKTFDM